MWQHKTLVCVVILAVCFPNPGLSEGDIAKIEPAEVSEGFGLVEIQRILEQVSSIVEVLVDASLGDFSELVDATFQYIEPIIKAVFQKVEKLFQEKLAIILIWIEVNKLVPLPWVAFVECPVNSTNATRDYITKVPHRADCRKYYQCLGDMGLEFGCIENTAFSTPQQKCVSLEDSDCKNKRKGTIIRTKRDLNGNKISKKIKRGKEKKKNKKASKEKNINRSKINNVPIIKARISNIRLKNDFKVEKYLGKLFKNLEGVKIEIVEICSDNFVSKIQYFVKEDENLATSLEKVLNYHPEFNSFYCDKKKSLIQITYVNDRENYWNEINNSQKHRNCASSNIDNFGDQFTKSSSNDLKLLCEQYCKFSNGLESCNQEFKKSKDISTNNSDNPSNNMIIDGYSSEVDESSYDSSNNNRNFNTENQIASSSRNSLSNENLLGNENEKSNQNYGKLIEIFTNNDFDKLQSNSEEIENFKSIFQLDEDRDVKEFVHNNPKCDNDDNDNNNNDYEDTTDEKNSGKNLQKSQNILEDSDIDVEDQFNSEPIYNFASINALNQPDYSKNDHKTSEEFNFDSENQNSANLETQNYLKSSDNSEVDAHLVENNNDFYNPTINYHTNIDVDGEFSLEMNDSSSLKPESMIDDDFNSSKYRESLKNNEAIVDESVSTEQQYDDTGRVDSSVSLPEEGDELLKGIHDYILDFNDEPKNISKKHHNNEYLHGDDNAAMGDDFDSQNTEMNFTTRDNEIDAVQGQHDNETSDIFAKSYLQEVTNNLDGDINTDEYQHTDQKVEDLLNVKSSNISANDLLGEDENVVNKIDYSEYSNNNEEAEVNLIEQFNIEPNKISTNDFVVEGDNTAVKNEHDEYQQTNQESDVNAHEYQSGPIDKTAFEDLHGIDTAVNNENPNTAQEYVNTEDQYTNGPGDISPNNPPNENYFIKGDNKSFENFDSPGELTKVNELGDGKTSSATGEDLLNDIPDREKLSGYNLETENTENNIGQNKNLYGGKQSSNELNGKKVFLANENDGDVSFVINDRNVKLNKENKDSDELKKEDLDMLNHGNIKLFAAKEHLDEITDRNTILLSRKEGSDEINDEYISNLKNTKEGSDKLIDENTNIYNEKEELDKLKDETINFTNRKESSHELSDESINFMTNKESSYGLTDKNINLNSGKQVYNKLIDENTSLNNRQESLDVLDDKKINLNIEKDGLNGLNNENIILNNSKDMLNELDHGDINLNESKDSLNILNNNAYNGKDNANEYNSQNGYLPYVNPGIHDGNAYLHHGNPPGLNIGNFNWQGVKNDGYANYQNVNSKSPNGDANFFKGKENVNVLNDRKAYLHGVQNNAPEFNTNGYLYGANNVDGNMYGTNNGHPLWYGAYNGVNANGINGHFNGYNGGVGNIHGIYNQNGLYGHNGVVGIPPIATGVIGIPPVATGIPRGNINGYSNFYGVNGGNPHLYGAYNGNEKTFTGHNTNDGALKGVEMNSGKSITENTKIPPQTTDLTEGISNNIGGSTNSLNSPFINQHSNNYINGNGQNYYYQQLPHYSNIHPPNTYNGHINGFDHANYQKHNVLVTKFPNPIVYTYPNPNDFDAKYQNQNDYNGKYKPPNSDINDGLAKTKSDAIVIPDTNNPINSKEKKHSLKIEINNKPFHVGELPRNAFDSLYKKTKDIIPATVDEQEFEKYFKSRSLKKAKASNEELTKREITDDE